MNFDFLKVDKILMTKLRLINKYGLLLFWNLQRRIMKLRILGLPDHKGVQNVGGRVGAKFGPEAFKIFFDKLNGDEQFQSFKKEYESLDLEKLNLEEVHDFVTKKVAEAHQNTDLTLIIGGGHDFIYSHTKGMANNSSVAVINIDPHLDMRPYDEKFTSGSPFRRLLDEKVIDSKQLVEFGIQKHANAPALFSYAKQNDIKIVDYSDLNEKNIENSFKMQLDYLSESADEIIISLDLDMLQASYAPGVSAPAVEGFSPVQIKRLLQIAGAHKKVSSLGIFELNPLLDIDDRTARLAAYCAYYFIDAKRKVLD
jgi:formiminoglutamase